MYPPLSTHHTLYGDMKLFILIIFCFLGIASSSCTYQVRTRTVQPGGSVTILCSYSGFEEPGEDKEIIWVDTDDETFCSYDNNKIFYSGNVTEKYKGRIYREKEPNRNWVEHITITGLEATDGPRYCCHLYNKKTKYSSALNRHGTLLLFPDTEYVTQLDEVLAVSSKEVVIPCYYSKDNSRITSVRWYFADRITNYCSDTTGLILDSDSTHQNSRYSLVNYPQDISLHIDDVQPNDHRSYCCVVYTEQPLLSTQFTRLVVADYHPSWDHPTKEISVQEGHSVTLNCSYTIPSDGYTERDIVWVNVYWRVENVTGAYAHHPYQEMIHPTYIHRTNIKGMANLMIKNVTKADNTSFHCFVVFKHCAGNNDYEDKSQYEGGTRLIVRGGGRDEPFNKSINDDPNPVFDPKIIIIICSAALLIILLIIIIVVLKVKGVICKKKTHFPGQQMNNLPAAGDVTSKEAPYCEITPKNAEVIPVVGTVEVEGKETGNGQTGDGEDGTLLYAKLNQTKLKEKRPAEQQKPQEEVIYSAVVKTK